MNLRDLAAEFGVPAFVLKALMPDLFPAHYRGSTYLPPNDVVIARNAWNARVSQYDYILFVDYQGPRTPETTPEGTMQLWREIRHLLSSSGLWGGGSIWEVTIDPFDSTGNVYIMVTQYGEMKWSDRGPHLADRLAGALNFLRNAMPKPDLANPATPRRDDSHETVSGNDKRERDER